MKRIFFALAAFAAIATASFANHDSRKDDFGFHGAFKALELSDEQKDKLKALKTARIEALKSAKIENGENFAAVFGGDSFNRAAFVSQENAKAVVHINDRADFLAELHAILTPAQREIFAKSLERKSERVAERPKH
ncbi:MAG: Spy/CpxP family protein refolding chaperone [Helicobacteraceae bacterium]|jgi:Spy/CpxP family protein refolding chaperone|nr:Spy/CpxP family protein refolding chaperone [Helicobacteraceae bacterium]